MDWKECYTKRIVKEVNLDLNLISALIKASKNKFISQTKLGMSEITAAAKLSLAYDSLRELLEAFTLNEGFKVYNHECYTAFIKEILHENEQGEMFDIIRRERNAINYYGKDVSEKDAMMLIDEISRLRNFFLDKLK